MGLAGEVLALHDAIQEVLVIENRAGDVRIIDQAIREGPSLLEAAMGAEKDTILLTPTVVLGVAARLGHIQRVGGLRLVGLLYEQRASVYVPISENSCLMASITKESLREVLQALEGMLPRLVQPDRTAESLTISSAVEADHAVQSFFSKTNLCEPSNVRLEDVTLSVNGLVWQVSGTYRPPHALRAKHYNIELDAKTGAVTKFQARP